MPFLFMFVFLSQCKLFQENFSSISQYVTLKLKKKKDKMNFFTFSTIEQFTCVLRVL